MLLDPLWNLLSRRGEPRSLPEALAEQLVSIFKAQKVHEQALAALTLFGQAAREHTATVELARRLGDYLYRAQHETELRFETC